MKQLVLQGHRGAGGGSLRPCLSGRVGRTQRRRSRQGRRRGDGRRRSPAFARSPLARARPGISAARIDRRPNGGPSAGPGPAGGGPGRPRPRLRPASSAAVISGITAAEAGTPPAELSQGRPASRCDRLLCRRPPQPRKLGPLDGGGCASLRGGGGDGGSRQAAVSRRTVREERVGRIGACRWSEEEPTPVCRAAGGAADRPKSPRWRNTFLCCCCWLQD